MTAPGLMPDVDHRNARYSGNLRIALNVFKGTLPSDGGARRGRRAPSGSQTGLSSIGMVSTQRVT